MPARTRTMAVRSMPSFIAMASAVLNPSLGLGRQLSDSCGRLLRGGGRCKRRVLRAVRAVLPPNPFDERIDGLSHEFADPARLWPILRQQPVEQNHVSGHVLDLTALGVIRA